MKLLRNRRLLIHLSLTLLFISCQKEHDYTNETVQNVPNEDKNGSAIVLGDELEIPYTAENMQTAFDNLLFNLKTTSKNSKLAKNFKTDKEIEVVPSIITTVFCQRTALNMSV